LAIRSLWFPIQHEQHGQCIQLRGVYFRLVGSVHYNNGTITLDNIVGPAIPEPTTGMLILGVSGLLLSGRRRRENAE